MAQKSIMDMANGNALLLAIMYVLVGLVMLAMGNGSISFIFWISGVLYVLIGILQIVLKSVDVKGGLITIIMGIILIVIGMLPAVAEVLVGLVLILGALPALLGTSNSLSKKFGMKPVDTGNAMVNKIVTILLLVVGVCLIVGLFVAGAGSISNILIRVGGLVMLLVGLLDLIKALKN